MKVKNYNSLMRFPYNIVLLLWLICAHHSAFAGDQITKTFHVDGMEQGIFLPVTINDLPYKLLIDTGATFTILDSSFKPLLGKAQAKTQTETSIGRSEVLFYKPVDIYAGGQNLTTKHQFLVWDLSFLTKVIGIEFHGIIGMAILYKHVWEVNFDERTLIMKSQSFKEKDDRGFERLTITLSIHGIPTIPVEAGNEKTDFLIDTGDNGFGRLQPELIDSLINQNLVESVAIDTTTSLSGIAKVRRIRVKEIKIGAYTYKNVVMMESLQNALGSGFLKRHRVIIDFPNKEFYFKKELNVFQPDREDKSGLKLISHNEKIVVALVDERGPAAKAGLIKGDVIVRFNESDVTRTDLLKVRDALKGSDGEEISIGINRSNENMDMRFNLKEGFGFVPF